MPFPLKIGYASESGRAQDLAYDFYFHLRRNGIIAVQPVCLDELELSGELVLFISTTGQGELPTNALKFWERLETAHSSRRQLAFDFSVFGCGDSKYRETFNAAALKIYGKLGLIGGTSVLNSIYCGDEEDQYGIEEEFYPFCDAFFQYKNLPAELKSEGTDFLGVDYPRPEGLYPAFVKDNREISHPSEYRTKEVHECRLIELISRLEWEAGDALKVFPPPDNSAFLDLVATQLTRPWLFELFKARNTNCPMNYRLYHLLVVFARKSAQDSQDFEKLELMEELALFSHEGQRMRCGYDYKERITFCDVLRDFLGNGSLNLKDIDFELLGQVLPPVIPRLYSIANDLTHFNRLLFFRRRSDMIQSNLVQLAVSVVNYKTPLGRHRLGVASNFLKNLAAGSSIMVDLVKSRSTTSLGKCLYIGTGTGCAPIRAILQREVFGTSSPSMLVLGFRKREGDLIFEADWKFFQSQGCLDTFELALSQEQDGKYYVQDLLEEKSSLLKSFFQGNSAAKIFIAGKSHPMPQQVLSSLRSVLGVPFINELGKQGRIVYDTWG